MLSMQSDTDSSCPNELVKLKRNAFLLNVKSIGFIKVYGVYCTFMWCWTKRTLEAWRAQPLRRKHRKICTSGVGLVAAWLGQQTLDSKLWGEKKYTRRDHFQSCCEPFNKCTKCSGCTYIHDQRLMESLVHVKLYWGKHQSHVISQWSFGSKHSLLFWITLIGPYDLGWLLGSSKRREIISDWPKILLLVDRILLSVCFNIIFLFFNT